MTLVSIIIPTLDEEDYLPATLATIDALGPQREVIVADGGSTDRTLENLPADVRVVRAPRGRARQMNAAAAVARGEVLLFLHADCRLPAGALATAMLALQDPQVVGGAFRKRFDGRSPLLAGGPARSSLWFRFGAFFGDQAMFVRRAVFDDLGGFDEKVLAEDMALARRLRRRGRAVLLPPVVTVSARRLEQRGILRTWSTWWWVAAREYAGRPLLHPGHDPGAVR